MSEEKFEDCLNEKIENLGIENEIKQNEIDNLEEQSTKEVIFNE
jgi:hypothetical protein